MSDYKEYVTIEMTITKKAIEKNREEVLRDLDAVLRDLSELKKAIMDGGMFWMGDSECDHSIRRLEHAVRLMISSREKNETLGLVQAALKAADQPEE